MLKPAAPPVPATASKKQNKNNDDQKRLSVHNVHSLETGAPAWLSAQVDVARGGVEPSIADVAGASVHARSSSHFAADFQVGRRTRGAEFDPFEGRGVFFSMQYPGSVALAKAARFR